MFRFLFSFFLPHVLALRSNYQKDMDVLAQMIEINKANDAGEAAKAQANWETTLEKYVEHHAVGVQEELKVGQHVAARWDSVGITLGCTNPYEKAIITEIPDFDAMRVKYLTGTHAGKERCITRSALKTKEDNLVAVSVPSARAEQKDGSVTFTFVTEGQEGHDVVLDDDLQVISGSEQLKIVEGMYLVKMRSTKVTGDDSFVSKIMRTDSDLAYSLRKWNISEGTPTWREETSMDASRDHTPQNTIFLFQPLDEAELADQNPLAEELLGTDDEAPKKQLMTTLDKLHQPGPGFAAYQKNILPCCETGMKDQCILS